MATGTHEIPLDTRVLAYRFLRDLAFCILIILCVKYFFCDSVRIKTDQMAPTLMTGDRVLTSRLAYAPVLKKAFKPIRGSIVIFEDPAIRASLGVLRIAAVAGDSITIENGQFVNAHHPEVSYGVSTDSMILPADYTPRDQMLPYCIPRAGDTLDLTSQNARNFFFGAALIRQENPEIVYRINPSLFIDGQETEHFNITGFALYKGLFDSIPEKLENDFFFWDRLKDALAQQTSKQVELSFAFMQGSSRIYNYTMKNNALFLLADDWYKGYDSRYFGPVSCIRAKGSVLAVLWSFNESKKRILGLRLDRIGKFVR